MRDLGDTAFLMIPDLLKATPSEEGGSRFVYLEASNEGLDQQGEVVLAKALEESASYYLRYGNLDIDHYTQIGARAGIPDAAMYEIGRPTEVRVSGSATMVKGEIYSGNGPAADRANQFWSSLTEVSPPQRWYPSVGGAVMAKSQVVDPQTRARRTVIEKVRWTNIGFSKTPVNQHVPCVETVPFGELAKSWGPAGLDLNKALAAGYGTDSATLSGGAALRGQSLDRKVHNYWDFRDRLADDLRKGDCPGGVERMTDYAHHRYGLDRHQAAEWTGVFMADLSDGLKQRRAARQAAAQPPSPASKRTTR